jgi:hypothetical protein
LAAVLSENVAPAAVPGALIHTTVDAAMASAAGSAVAAGVISERVAALTSGVLKTMFLAKLKFVGAVALTASVLSTGAGILTYRMAGAVAADTGEEPAKKALADAVWPAAQKQRPLEASTTPSASDLVKPPAAAGDKDQKGEPDRKIIEAKPQERPPQEEKQPLKPHQLRALLARPINLDRGIDPNTPLRDALEHFEQTNKGMTILLNRRAFEEELGIQEIDQQPVRLPRMTGVPLGTILDMLLRQVNGRYLIRPGFIEITPPVRVWPEAWVFDENGFNRHWIPTVDVAFAKRPLEDAFEN